MTKTSCKKGQYYCNTDKKCKPIPEGYTVREDGFLVKEGWSAKYKKSIDCDNPKGFSQKAHCAGKKKKMTEESNPRIARKKGQPAKSKNILIYILMKILKELFMDLVLRMSLQRKRVWQKLGNQVDHMLIKFKQQLLWSKEQE